MLLWKVLFLIRKKDSSKIREAGNTNKSIFMWNINFRVIQALSLYYFKKYREATATFELPTVTLLLITNMLLWKGFLFETE